VSALLRVRSTAEIVPAQSLECGLQPRRDVGVDAIHRLARVFERLTKVSRVALVRSALIASSGSLSSFATMPVISLRGRQRCSAPPATPGTSGLQSISPWAHSVKVEGHKELPGEQVAAPELRAQTPLLDQALHERVALLYAPN